LNWALCNDHHEAFINDRVKLKEEIRESKKKNVKFQKNSKNKTFLVPPITNGPTIATKIGVGKNFTRSADDKLDKLKGKYINYKF